MSRTDKDIPWWILPYTDKRFARADHGCGDNKLVYVGKELRTKERTTVRAVGGTYNKDGSVRRPFSYETIGTGEFYTYTARVYERRSIECDLGKIPHSKWDPNVHCTYEINWRNSPLKWWRQTPGWWIRETTRVPERRRERDTLRDAIKWHRADPDNFNEDFDFGLNESHVPYYW